jgi:D-alanyl-D-alanine carboxypeptidase
MIVWEMRGRNREADELVEQRMNLPSGDTMINSRTIPRAPFLLAILGAGLLAACAPATTATPPNPHPAAPASTAPLMQALDSLMRATFPADQPGAAVIVTRNGETLLRGGYGMADLELGVAIRPDHVFRIGSVTKQFTGVAILMLEQEGRLSLSDPLTRFFPDYPTGGQHVTVEHLLGHTSGIRSYTEMESWAETRRQDLGVEELIAMFRDEPFDFAPGESWRYNNSGYILLGAIVEQLSGMPYGEFVEKRIFAPLGMTRSHYGEHERVLANRIPGYSRRGDGWVNADFLSMTHPYAAGSLLSSVDDLARWNAAIQRGELLDAERWRRAFQPVLLNDGRSTSYGAGFMTGWLGPYTTIEHGGGINGFISQALSVPEAGVFVAVLTNADGPLGDPTALSLQLADMVLGGVRDAPAVAVTPQRLSQYVGVYRIAPDATRTITYEDGVLYSQRSGGSRLELRPIGEDLFLFPATGARLVFERQAGAVVRMILEPRLGMGDSAVRTDEAPSVRRAITLPSESYLPLPGTYRLAPGFEIRVTREGDQLHAQATGQERFSIYPESATRFFFTVVDAVLEFHLENGRATGLTLHQGGRSLPGPRVD